MKVCTRCGGPEKPLEEFAKNNRAKDGRKSICKACLRADWHEKDSADRRAKRKAHHEANRDQINAKRRDDRAADPEKARAEAKAYYKANGDRVRANNRRSAARHKDRVQVRNQRYYQEHQDELLEYGRAYWRANRDTLIPKNKARWERNKVRYRKTARKWLERNRDKMLAYYRDKGREHRQFLGGLKDVPCVGCGGTFPSFCMEFDHVQGEKRFALGKMANHRREAVLEEIAKCDLVCANCHRVRSHERRELTSNRRLRLFREKVAALKNRPCLDCGGTFPPQAMDFDHLESKVQQVSDMWSWSWEKVLVEISKCELVCANCHRVRTEARRNEHVEVRA